MKIAVGMSGGVDSSVAALLLRDAGHEVSGVLMTLWPGGAAAPPGQSVVPADAGDLVPRVRRRSAASTPPLMPTAIFHRPFLAAGDGPGLGPPG